MYKMKDSTGRNTITMWFNTELFNINGKPLKFHLEGYDKIEFCNLVKIIRAYGGELSEPTGDTIIFSEPDHPAGIHQRYNLKYLRDSIIANELLELEQYELPLAANHHHCDVKNRGDVLNKEETLEKKFTTSTKIISGDSSSGDEASGAARTRPSVFLRKRKINDEKPVREEAEKKLCKRNTSPHNKFVLHEENPISSEKGSKKGGKASLDNQSSLNKPVENKKRGGNSFTAEEKRQMIQYLVDKNAISCGKSVRIWKQMIADLKITHRSAEHLRNQFRRQLSKDYEQYTDDIDVRKKLEQVYSTKRGQPIFTEEENRQIMQFLIENNAISRAGGNRVWSEMLASKKITQRIANDLRSHFFSCLMRKHKQYTDDTHALEEFAKLNESFRKGYTDEEYRKIIQYLIDKKSISRACGRSVWKEMRADDVTYRSVASLRTNFIRNLKHNYKKYTQDAEAHEEFEKLINREKYPHKHGLRIGVTRWTEEENQIVIDYLIENDVIHRIGSRILWREVAKKVRLENKRTEGGLRKHFAEVLRYNYRKYTSDPEALKKFAAVAKKEK